jgi:hypothetical protein
MDYAHKAANAARAKGYSENLGLNNINTNVDVRLLSEFLENPAENMSQANIRNLQRLYMDL